MTPRYLSMEPLTLMIQTRNYDMADLRNNEVVFPKGLLRPSAFSECILVHEDSW